MSIHKGKGCTKRLLIGCAMLQAGQSQQVVINKESLIEYAKVKDIEINMNDSFNDIFKQTTGKSNESYLKKYYSEKRKYKRF